MISFRSAAVVAMVAMASANLMGQDFARITTAGRNPSVDGVTQAVYASLSDSDSGYVDGIAQSQQNTSRINQVAYESINDFAEPTNSDAERASLPSEVHLDEIADHNGAGVVQVGLLDPACGVADLGAGCGAEASCGLPTGGLLGPACGLPEATCGIGEPACGADACVSCGDALPCGALCTRQCPSCCGVGTHYTNFYGELLYLRARNAEVSYAVPADGPIVGAQPSPVQVGNLGVLDPDYEVGFRAGLNVALDTVSSLDIRYTLFESLTENQISATAPIVLRSLVTHPSTASAAQDGLSAVASLEVDFDWIDFSYRHLLKCSELYSANYVVGARYAKLEQQFHSEFVKQGLETVATDIDFDGGGLRLGLETARYSCRNQLHVYANGYASFMAGRFRAHYFQGQAFDPTVVNAEWEAGRIVPILDLEAGVGWTSTNGRLNLSAGYLVSAWFNTVTTQDFVHAIQSNNYLGLSDTMTFDGLQARFSYQF